MIGKDDDPRRGAMLCDLTNSISTVQESHEDISDDDVRARFDSGLEQGAAVLSRAYDPKIGREEFAQTSQADLMSIPNQKSDVFATHQAG